jgi:hypothetical protein
VEQAALAQRRVAETRESPLGTALPRR